MIWIVSAPPASAVWRAARMSERHLWKFPWKNPWANVMGYLGLCSVHWWAKFQLITASTDLWMVVGNRDYAYWYNDVYLPTAMDLRVLVKSYDWHDSSYHVSMPHESFFLQFLHVFFLSLYPGKFLRILDIIKYKSIHYIYICINHQGDLRNLREGTNPISYNLLRERDSVMLLAHAELVKVLEIQHVISRGIAVSISGWQNLYHVDQQLHIKYLIY